MKLQFIQLDKLVVSKTNMRWGRKAPDVSDILPSVRKRGVIQPILVRPNCAPDGYEIIAGRRRFTAALIDAEERRADGREVEPLPCAILDSGDDADAVEASLLENVARLDADEVTQWVNFTRLVREGRDIDDIAATFAMPEPMVRRILALGNLLPRIRAMYARDEIDRATVRTLTLASKRQQTEWLTLVDDKTQRAPLGSHLKAWLMGGQSIPAKLALFDIAASGLASVADLFGEDRYFADAGMFWIAQDAAIEARRTAYLESGWSEAVIVPKGEYFHEWEYEKCSKDKGGRVYIDVQPSGEVVFHEGYVTRKEAERRTKSGKGAVAEHDKPVRAEITSACQTYVDLHRHAAVRAALTDHGGVALRLMVAHLVIGSPLWTVRRESHFARDEGTRASVADGLGDMQFDDCRRAVLALLDMPLDKETFTGAYGGDHELVRLFLRLMDLPDAAVMDVITVAMGETLASGSAAVAAVGATLGLDMADWWEADAAFLDLVRDKEVLRAMVGDVAGSLVASANASEKGATLKRIIADHLSGASGRDKVARWVPRWMAFPASAYTRRGGVGTVKAGAVVAAARAEVEDMTGGDPDTPTTPGGVAVAPEAGNDDGGEAQDLILPEALAA
ncbi:MAG TPA: ParB N-terminal domain-containing protein [Sphingomonas sp.]|nr:ParB N-terminal domain-containing protein [Sphingomonas sp.]